MKKYYTRTADKNYFLLPNEIFKLDLSAGEISVYSYLMSVENRKTFTCHPSFKKIGDAIKMTVNTVRKYVLSLEEKRLIKTEPTQIITKDGKKQNGSLMYNIRPIQEAVEIHNRNFLFLLDAEKEKIKVCKGLEKAKSSSSTFSAEENQM